MLSVAETCRYQNIEVLNSSLTEWIIPPVANCCCSDQEIVATRRNHKGRLVPRHCRGAFGRPRV